MSSFVAHAVTGIATLEVARAVSPGLFRDRRWMGVFPALAALPDIDAVLAALGGSAFDFLSVPGGYPIHRGVTHSLAFAIAAGTVAVILCLPRSPRRWLAAWPWMAVAASTHALTDTLMGLGAGIPLFWPLSGERYLSPFRLVPVAYFSYSVGGLVSLLWSPTVWALTLHELVIFLPVLFVARRWRLGRDASALAGAPASRCPRLAAAIAACAVACPAMTFTTALRPVEAGGGFPAPWLGAWLVIVAAALLLLWDARRGLDRAPPHRGPFLPVALAVLIASFGVYLV